MQTDLFSSIPLEQEQLPDCIQVIPRFLTKQQAELLYGYLSQQSFWQQPEILVYGKSHRIPRFQAWMGDKGVSYQYSGKRFDAEGWNDHVFQIKSRIEQEVGRAFNTCLLNYYRDGQDKMGWHADNEPELGVNPVVVALSLGSERAFQFKNHKDKVLHSVELTSGSLLIMKAGMQSRYLHQIPVRKNVGAGRISLTFRNILR